MELTVYPVGFFLSLSAPGVPPTPERGKCILFPGASAGVRRRADDPGLPRRARRTPECALNVRRQSGVCAAGERHAPQRRRCCLVPRGPRPCSRDCSKSSSLFSGASPAFSAPLTSRFVTIFSILRLTISFELRVCALRKRLPPNGRHSVVGIALVGIESEAEGSGAWSSSATAALGRTRQPPSSIGGGGGRRGGGGAIGARPGASAAAAAAAASGLDVGKGGARIGPAEASVAGGAPHDSFVLRACQPSPAAAAAAGATGAVAAGAAGAARSMTGAVVMEVEEIFLGPVYGGCGAGGGALASPACAARWESVAPSCCDADASCVAGRGPAPAPCGSVYPPESAGMRKA